MKAITKPGLINGVLWLAFILAMLSSIQHIAWTFGTVEQAGQAWLGWIPAVAVDSGLAALAYSIQQRRKAKRPVRGLWAGVGLFALISALANFYHALSVESGGLSTLSAFARVDILLIAKAIILSATLPALVVYLSEIVSGDDAQAGARATQAAARELAQAEREQRRADLVAEAAAADARARLLAAEAAAAQATQAAAPSEPAPVICEDCGRVFRSVNARNAHHCEGRAVASEPQPLAVAPSNGRAHV